MYLLVNIFDYHTEANNHILANYTEITSCFSPAVIFSILTSGIYSVGILNLFHLHFD